MTTAISVSEDDAKYCLNQLRDQSPDFYLSSLLLPSAVRADIVALHTFHTEVSGITLASPEPIAGEIRLQWWMEVLNRQREEEAAQHPLARSLLSVMEAHNLPAGVLVSKLEAHIFDLYSDPMGDQEMLEAYFGETRSALFQLAALIIEKEAGPNLANVSGHAGVATGCISILENLARHRAQHHVYFPSDLLTKTDLNAEQFLLTSDSRHSKAVSSLVEIAELHFSKAVSALKTVPPDFKPIFAPLALVPVYLKRIRKRPETALNGISPVSQLARQWALWRF